MNLNMHDVERAAASRAIFNRALRLHKYGACFCVEADPATGRFEYEVDGSFGDYKVLLQLNDHIEASCDCPYPGRGCKHIAACLLDIMESFHETEQAREQEHEQPSEARVFLSPEEIKILALEDRKIRAKKERFKVIQGDMFKGEHLLETSKGRQYQVIFHDPAAGIGHCSCPDYHYNRLGTCKHLIFLAGRFREQKDFMKRVKEERFPFVDIYWDSSVQGPRLFHELSDEKLDGIRPTLNKYFDSDGTFVHEDICAIFPDLEMLRRNKKVRIQPGVLTEIQRRMQDMELKEASKRPLHALSAFLKTAPYPYQEEGIRFSTCKKASLIGDEMGLGKTLQAIGASLIKRELFGFEKVLVVTLASLKRQWKREIERFTSQSAEIVEGPAAMRKKIYRESKAFFKITNYEAVLRDVTVLRQFRPDIVILDEAQRIKNFETKTADAVKSIPREHSIVLTGTPLENKLEDVYSIVQFLDPGLLSPLWQFAADHFLLSRNRKNRILGYTNLGMLKEKLKPLVIRRKKAEVLDDLPEQTENNFFVQMHHQQAKIHAGYIQSLFPLLNKKVLTPMDIRRIQELLLKMRQACNSTFLIDRKTNISPKLDELEVIIKELVQENGRKVVIFSEWTTMIYLIAKRLSRAGISFVELTGRIPVKKRQQLIDEFTENPDCRVFLSSDAGGTGLNLQAADCVINFEPPWNPAKLNQRIGRVSRIGQKSSCINVINFITRDSIEEKILAGLQLKSELFAGVFDQGEDQVVFSREKRQEMVNKIREMMGEEHDESVSAVGELTPATAEDTPFFLNPKAMEEEIQKPGPVQKVEKTEPVQEYLEGLKENKATGETHPQKGSGMAESIKPEEMETVINSGLQFINTLFQAVTGKCLAGDAEEKMVKVDRETGEVTMKFKLPGFKG